MILKPRHYLGLTALALTSTIGVCNAGDYLIRKYQEKRIEKIMEKQEQLIENQERIIEEQEQLIEELDKKITMENLTDKDKKVVEYFKEWFTITTCNVTNQEGKSVNVTDLLKESVEGKEAKKYARKLVKKAYTKNKGKKFNTLESKIQLAKEIMDDARINLQVKDWGGESTYFRAYEFQKSFTTEEMLVIEEELNKAKTTVENELDNVKECSEYYHKLEIFYRANSVQTYDQFYGPKNGKKLAGDCDDFSTALTTIYHAVKDYAETNKNKKQFYKSLAEGLDHYGIYSLGIPEHWLNLSVLIQGERVDLEVIEPQSKSTKYDIRFKALTDEKGNEVEGLFIKDKDRENDVERKVLRLFNKDFYAHSKDDI